MTPGRAEEEKRAAAEAAAELVEPGMTVGLGTGSTVAHLLEALAGRRLGIRCVSTSLGTEEAARGLGLPVEPFDAFESIDLAIDGADQVTPDFWLMKGGGAAHTREKLVAAAAQRFVVIVDSSKLVERLAPPVPLELMAFGLTSTLARLQPATLRPVAPSPDGGIIADYFGAIDDPKEVAGRLSSTPGVVDHGIFPPALVSDVVIARGRAIEVRRRRP